jgi:hypothetical protein
MATAKRSTAGRSTRASASAPASSVSANGGASTVMQWFQNPAVRYVAGGIATAFLAKLATNMADRYPQISQLLRDGLESVEGKLADFNGASAGSEESSSAPMTSTRSKRSANANLSTH